MTAEQMDAHAAHVEAEVLAGNRSGFAVYGVPFADDLGPTVSDEDIAAEAAYHAFRMEALRRIPCPLCGKPAGREDGIHAACLVEAFENAPAEMTPA